VYARAAGEGSTALGVKLATSSEMNRSRRAPRFDRNLQAVSQPQLRLVLVETGLGSNGGETQS
jgi:hypothetical protein